MLRRASFCAADCTRCRPGRHGCHSLRSTQLAVQVVGADSLARPRNCVPTFCILPAVLKPECAKFNRGVSREPKPGLCQRWVRRRLPHGCAKGQAISALPAPRLPTPSGRAERGASFSKAGCCHKHPPSFNSLVDLPQRSGIICLDYGRKV